MTTTELHQTEKKVFELERIPDDKLIFEMYIEALNNNYGVFKMDDLEFKASEILEKIDPKSFEYGFQNYKKFMYNF